MKIEDSLYATARERIVDFAFDAAVAAVFPDMIRRSVPGYGEIIALTGLLAEQYAQPGSHCYDLGCSLGAASLSMRRRIPHGDCRIIAVDNAPAMLEQARAHLAQAPGTVPVELRCADVREVAIEDASVVALNFTLQFIEPAERLPLLQRIHAGLRPDGVLILSEKLMFANEQEQDFNTAMHLAFKRANGYSELEISQKRSALEHVLVPDTREQHEERLRWAGFRRSECWFRCFNFASFVAFK
jgi:tRNA (cmo5U34)-methyltransferase